MNPMATFSEPSPASGRWAVDANRWIVEGRRLVGEQFEAVVPVKPGTFEFATALAPAFALGLALVHLFSAHLLVAGAIPRSRWLSLSGGVSVGYVFVHLLPEVQAVHLFVDRSDTVLAAIEGHVYVIALLGFTTFYGLERYVRCNAEGSDQTDPGNRAFHLHVGSFAVYNALVGWLLLEKVEYGVAGLAAFSVALGLHFVVNDYGLRERHGAAYHRYGRWVLAAAVLLGFGIAHLVTVSHLLVLLLFAFLAGGIVLNVIKEELPAERESRFGSFAVGALGYAGLLIVL